MPESQVFIHIHICQDDDSPKSKDVEEPCCPSRDVKEVLGEIDILNLCLRLWSIHVLQAYL